MNVQRPGPPYRFQAQGTVWSTDNPGPRGTIRFALLLVGIFVAGVLAVVAVG